MFVIEVIPLTVLPPNVPQILSYFFDKKLERGAVVQISIGHRSVKAIVVSSTPLAEHKMGLKKAEFQLKKLSEVLMETPQISDRQLHIALWLSKTYYSPLGICLKTVLPPFFLKKKFLPILSPTPSELQNRRSSISQPSSSSLGEIGTIKKPLFILTDAKNALKNLMPLIKSAVNKNGQIVLVVPDNQTLDHFYKNLSKDFETVKVSSELGNKAFFDAWQNVQNGKVQVVVGTRQALFLPFKKLALVVIDDPLHEFYKSDMSPKYNAAALGDYIARTNNCSLVYLSFITGVENYFCLKNETYKLVDKTSSPPVSKTINMVSEIKSGNFSILSRELQNSLINLSDKNKKVLIFSPRRGYSGILVCQNCGYTAKCINCETAYRIHRAEDLVLMCHHCGSTQRLPGHCPNCNSSKLRPIGPTGSQKIYEEIRRVLSQNEISGVPVLILDIDVTANQTEEDEVMSEIAHPPAGGPRTSILIATQMIFSYRYDHNFDFIAIMNADSLVQSPDFKTEERLFYQLEKLFDFLPAGRHDKPGQILIQTFNPENPAIVMAAQRNYKDFYEKELTIRQALSYPPFSRLIKLTFRHPDREVASREARMLAGKLKMAVVQLKLSDKIKITDSSPGYTEKERGLYTYNIVVKSLTGQTPREILKFVPSRWLIDVDPRTLL